MNKRNKMYEDIQRHGEQLNAIFHTDLEPIALCKKLHSLEIKGNRLATHGCNGTINPDEYEAETDKILDKVDNILGFRKANIPVFFNGDARGYALKIDSEYMSQNKTEPYPLHQDWGGYGIIAPDFTPNH